MTAKEIDALLAEARRVDGLFGFASIGTVAAVPRGPERELAAERQAEEAHRSGLRRLALITTPRSSEAELDAVALLVAAFDRVLARDGN